MKKYQGLLLLSGILVLCGDTLAQSKMDSLRIVDGIWSLKKRAVVLQCLQLTEGEKSSFWPVYESYHSAIQYLEMEHIFLTARFRKEYKMLGGRELAGLSAQILKNDLLLARVRKQYFKKFRKALSLRQASIFMHLDKTFRAIMREEMQNDLPPVEVLHADSYTRRQ